MRDTKRYDHLGRILPPKRVGRGERFHLNVPHEPKRKVLNRVELGVACRLQPGLLLDLVHSFENSLQSV